MIEEESKDESLNDSFGSDVAVVGAPIRSEVVWVNTPLSKAETTIVFDWDDTLLASSWLITAGFDTYCLDAPTEEMVERCAPQAAAAKAILERAKSLGEVIIITNSVEGWIEKSCAIFMPAVVPLLRGMHIVYAQNRYRARYGPSSAVWKEYAFMDEMEDSFARPPGLVRNLVSIGDGIPEQAAMRAVQIVYEAMKDGPTLVKIVKMLDGPNPEVLQKQLEGLDSVLEAIVCQCESLDMVMTI